MSIKRYVSKTKYFQGKELFNEATICRLRATNLIPYNYDIHGVIEALQHCFELSLKAIWLVYGLTYPNIHDAAKNIDKVTVRMKLLFPHRDYASWGIISNWIKEQSSYMAELHHRTIYGDVDKGVPASKLFSLEETQKIYQTVTAFHAFVKGSILFVGEGLNLLTPDEERYLRDFRKESLEIYSDPEKIEAQNKRLSYFLNR